MSLNVSVIRDFFSKGTAGIGGILRGDDGNFMAAFFVTYLRNSNNVAELWAIREGMQLAADIGVKKLIIETDSTYSFNLCLKSYSCSWLCTCLMRDIRHLSLVFDQVCFQHHYREGNFAADILFKKAANECISSRF